MLVAFDTETFLFNDQCRIPKMVCASFAFRDGNKIERTLLTDKDAKPLLIDLLKDKNVVITGQNIAFDTAGASVNFGWEVAHLINEKYKNKQILCTMLNEMFLRLSTDGKLTRKQFTLEFLVQKYLGIKIDKGADTYRMRYGELYGKPISEYPKAAYDYAVMDAVLTLQVAEKQGLANNVDMYEQFHTYYLTTLISAMGMKVDQNFLDERFEPLNNKMMEHEYVLRKEGFKKPPYNKNYLEWLQSYGLNLELQGRIKVKEKCQMYEKALIKARADIYADSIKAKVPFTKNTKFIKESVEKACLANNVKMEFTDGGKKEIKTVSTKMDFLLGLQGFNTALDAYIDLGSAEFIINTFLMNWTGKNKVCSQFGLAETGRFTSYDTNMMNLPRKGRIRGVFVPEFEGNCFSSHDWGQIELCTLAEIMYVRGCGSEMLDAINEKMDLHALTGSNMLGISYEAFLERLGNEDKDCMQFRSLAKVTNFGGGGGMGAHTLMVTAKKQGVKIDGKFITEAQAKEALIALKKTFPLQKYFNLRKDEIRHTEYGTFYECKLHGTDRIRMISAVDSTGENEGYCAANNTPFQGLASDICKETLRTLCDEAWFKKTKYLEDVIPRMIVYDEFINEMPIKTAHDSAMAITKIMVDVAKKRLPHVKVIKAEPALQLRWEKEAKTIYDKNGKLAIWDYETHGKKKV